MSELAHLVKAMREAQKLRANIPFGGRQIGKRAATIAQQKAEEAVEFWLNTHSSSDATEIDKDIAALLVEAMYKKTRKLPAQNEFDQIDKILDSIVFDKQK